MKHHCFSLLHYSKLQGHASTCHSNVQIQQKLATLADLANTYLQNYTDTTIQSYVSVHPFVALNWSTTTVFQLNNNKKFIKVNKI